MQLPVPSIGWRRAGRWKSKSSETAREPAAGAEMAAKKSACVARRCWWGWWFEEDEREDAKGASADEAVEMTLVATTSRLAPPLALSLKFIRGAL